MERLSNLFASADKRNIDHISILVVHGERALWKVGGHVIECDQLCRRERSLVFGMNGELRNCNGRGQLNFQVGASGRTRSQVPER